MRYDIPNPYAAMRFDLLYGSSFKVLTGPSPILRHWAQRELEEGIPWLLNEFRLQDKELARADDDGMRQVSEAEKHG